MLFSPFIFFLRDIHCPLLLDAIQTFNLFARLISHQPAVFFYQNKPATSQQYSSPNRLV
jgi:hypothetical protein